MRVIGRPDRSCMSSVQVTAEDCLGNDDLYADLNSSQLGSTDLVETSDEARGEKILAADASATPAGYGGKRISMYVGELTWVGHLNRGMNCDLVCRMYSGQQMPIWRMPSMRWASLIYWKSSSMRIESMGNRRGRNCSCFSVY